MLAISFQKITLDLPKIIPAHIDELQVVQTAINISDGSINPKFFRYPSGHINILAANYKLLKSLGKDLNQKAYYKIAWYLSNVYMAMIPVLIFVMCYLLLSQKIGILGGILCSMSPLVITHSQYAIVDVPMTFFITLFFTLTIFWYKNNNLDKKSLIVLSILAGITISMKYTAALLIPSFFILAFNYNQSKKTNDIYLSIILYSIALLSFTIGLLIYFFKKEIINNIISLTTDGIVEVEYIDGIYALALLAIIISLIFIFIIIIKPKIILNLLKNILCLTNLKFSAIIIITFSILSPFTLIEYKESFTDFMYDGFSQAAIPGDTGIELGRDRKQLAIPKTR